MDKRTIVRQISERVDSAKVPSYSDWRIGLTHAPTTRKGEHQTDGEDTQYWQKWTADSLSDAQDIESYFIRKGMKGGTGGNLSSRKTVYVYIF